MYLASKFTNKEVEESKTYPFTMPNKVKVGIKRKRLDRDDT